MVENSTNLFTRLRHCTGLLCNSQEANMKLTNVFRQCPGAKILVLYLSLLTGVCQPAAGQDKGHRVTTSNITVDRAEHWQHWQVAGGFGSHPKC